MFAPDVKSFNLQTEMGKLDSNLYSIWKLSILEKNDGLRVLSNTS